MRLYWLSLTLLTLIMLIAALILQHAFAMVPCSLCIFSRFSLILVLILCFCALLHGPKTLFSRGLWHSLVFMGTVAGVFISLRHSWLIHYPSNQANSCGPGFNYLLETLPFTEFLATIFKGTGDCAKKLYIILGLPLAHWTSIAFVGLLIIQLVATPSIIKSKKKGG